MHIIFSANVPFRDQTFLNSRALITLLPAIFREASFTFTKDLFSSILEECRLTSLWKTFNDYCCFSKPQIGPILSKPHYWFSYSSHSKLELGRKGRNTFSVSTTEGMNWRQLEINLGEPLPIFMAELQPKRFLEARPKNDHLR